jgi:signal transduction histidine kinase
MARTVLRADAAWLSARAGCLDGAEVLLAGERVPEASSLRRLPIEEAGVSLGELGLAWAEAGEGGEDPDLEGALCEAAAALLRLAREELASRRLLHVQEQELCRIVLDIHDGPVQDIFAALSQIQLVRTQSVRTGGLGRDARRRLERAAQLLERCLSEIRAFVGAFRPPEFEHRPLLSMVEGLVLQHEMFTGHQVRLEVEGAALPEPPLPVKIAFYRLLQEALNNAARHAGVARYAVRLRGEPRGLWLEVRDEGRGFDPADYLGTPSPEAMSHFGLRGMRDRAELVGGRFEIESAPGQGTAVRVWLPC